jgi:hypothetical protein
MRSRENKEKKGKEKKKRKDYIEENRERKIS